MRTDNIAAILMEGCKTVSVRFNEESKEYTYKTLDILEEGDLVVVKANGKHKIAKVSSVHKIPKICMDSNIKYEWIVQKVDKSEYIRLNEAESEFRDHLLEMEQQAVRNNALAMLTEKLGLDDNSLDGLVKKLNG